jgi:hypothetical protein
MLKGLQGGGFRRCFAGTLEKSVVFKDFSKKLCREVKRGA